MNDIWKQNSSFISSDDIKRTKRQIINFPLRETMLKGYLALAYPRFSEKILPRGEGRTIRMGSYLSIPIFFKSSNSLDQISINAQENEMKIIKKENQNVTETISLAAE